MSESDKKLSADIGAEIRRIRKERGISALKLSEKCGVSWTHIYKIETGTHGTSLTALSKICESLGVNMADVMPKSQGKEVILNARN